MIHQLRTSLYAASLKCEHKTYEPTSLVSPHESNRIWTSLLISSCAHHHPWTYSLMAQHPLIQVSHHSMITKTTKAHYTTQGTYSSWTQGFQCFHKPTLSWSNSTNLPARSPTLRTSPSVVQHTWSTNYDSPRSQHLLCVSTEHTNLPRSYPHTRVAGYEPPRSYHHVFITSHEPTRSWQHQAYPKLGPTQQVVQNIPQHTLPLHHCLA